MSPFEHYLYVLECGDGSLYTGYAVDVQARLETHQSGRGARYTKSHAPVKLVAQARFYSKQRAMSAEAHFKQLSRGEKDRLLAIAGDAALERIEAFLPHIDNWATCDQLTIKALGWRPEETLARVERWLASGRCYTMRFAIRVLMVQFLDERFEPRFLDMVAEAHLVIRKAIESRRVSAEMKEQLRELR